jgi:hypothetical protein
MGTIEALDAQSLSLALEGGGTMTLALGEDSLFLRGFKEVGREEVIVGERAVVTCGMDDESHIAIKIRLRPTAD